MEIDNNYDDIERARPKSLSTFSKKGLIALIVGTIATTGLIVAGDRAFRSVESDYYKAQDAIIVPYAEKAENAYIEREMEKARYDSN